MRLLVVSFAISCVSAAPQSYGPPPSTSFSPGGYGGGGGGGGYGGGGGGGCAEGEVMNVDGSCVRPIVTRNIFVYAAPQIPGIIGPPPPLPQPKIDYNIVFIRTPEAPEGQEPIVIPPPQQKTLVYVLNKLGQAGGQQVIEVPAGPNQSPEVYYVNYNDGDNPTLPGGFTLQEALSSAAAQEGQLIGGGGGGGYGGGGGGGGGFGGGGGSGYAAPPPPSGGGRY